MSAASPGPRSPRRKRSGAPEGVDGRTERAARTRQSIVTAIVELVGAGNLTPTAEEVAQYAGVGHRTVFRHFQDMETLFFETNNRVKTVVETGLSATPAAVALEDRIKSLVEERARVFETIAPFYMSGAIRSYASRTIQRSRAQFARLLRTQLIAHLPELEASPDLAAAAELLTSVDGWLRLRHIQGLTPDEAGRSQRAALLALLPAVPG